MATTELEHQGSATVELRVMITEDAHGELLVQWEGRKAGTEVMVPMRPAHVIGMLQSAIFVIMGKTFSGFRDKVQQAAGLKSKSVEGPTTHYEKRKLAKKH